MVARIFYRSFKHVEIVYVLPDGLKKLTPRLSPPMVAGTSGVVRTGGSESGQQVFLTTR